VTGAVVGVRRADQVAELRQAAQLRLYETDLREISNFLAGYDALSGDAHAQAFRGEFQRC